MIRKCYKQKEFVGRIQKALGVNMGPVSCQIVDTDGMQKVMRGAGWSKNEVGGVVGFQVDKKVYVLDKAPWTVLHELIHRAGVNSDRLSRYVAEGLTEVIAGELKQGSDEHRATYPEESRWVKTQLLPRLNMSGVQLGRVIANSPNPPRDLAALMAKAKPGTDARKLERELAPQRPNAPSFNRTHVTRVGNDHSHAMRSWRGSAGQTTKDDTHTERIGAVLLVASAALLAPGIMRRMRGNA